MQRIGMWVLIYAMSMTWTREEHIRRVEADLRPLPTQHSNPTSKLAVDGCYPLFPRDLGGPLLAMPTGFLPDVAPTLTIDLVPRRTGPERPGSSLISTARLSSEANCSRWLLRRGVTGSWTAGAPDPPTCLEPPACVDLRGFDTLPGRTRSRAVDSTSPEGTDFVARPRRCFWRTGGEALEARLFSVTGSAVAGGTPASWALGAGGGAAAPNGLPRIPCRSGEAAPKDPSLPVDPKGSPNSSRASSRTMPRSAILTR